MPEAPPGYQSVTVTPNYIPHSTSKTDFLDGLEAQPAPCHCCGSSLFTNMRGEEEDAAATPSGTSSKGPLDPSVACPLDDSSARLGAKATIPEANKDNRRSSMCFEDAILQLISNDRRPSMELRQGPPLLPSPSLSRDSPAPAERQTAYQFMCSNSPAAAAGVTSVGPTNPPPSRASSTGELPLTAAHASGGGNRGPEASASCATPPSTAYRPQLQRVRSRRAKQLRPFALFRSQMDTPFCLGRSSSDTSLETLANSVQATTWLLFEVFDSGVGISQEGLTALFNEFVQASGWASLLVLTAWFKSVFLLLPVLSPFSRANE